MAVYQKASLATPREDANFFKGQLGDYTQRDQLILGGQRVGRYAFVVVQEVGRPLYTRRVGYIPLRGESSVVHKNSNSVPDIRIQMVYAHKW